MTDSAAANTLGGQDARAIANFALDRADRLGIGVSNMHVNKIVYFAHGHFLASRRRSLVDQPFEAWEYGPVVQDLYHRFKKFGRLAISERALVLDKARGEFEVARCVLCREESHLLQELCDFYIRIPPGRLSDMSHKKGGPWDQIWNYEGKSNPGMFIPNNLILEWFAASDKTIAGA